MTSSSTTTTTTTTFRGLPVVPTSDPSLHAPSNSSVARGISKTFLARSVPEGMGARVRRSIGSAQLRNFLPFLMLDHFDLGPGAGFPDHPHRGQETITYLLHGAVDHEDFAGHKGTIESGGLQFMTAGKGIVHSEIPRPNEDGSNTLGFQLWVDLPKELKYCEPRYRDLDAKEIPSVDVDDGKVHIKVISGQSHGVDSVKELAYTPVWLLDIEMKPGSRIEQPIPLGWNSFAYLFQGTAKFGTGEKARDLPQYHFASFEQQGDKIVVENEEGSPENARFILVAGLPHEDKVVQYGPFVVNSQEEVHQAFEDYQLHKNGFERAKNWESEIGKAMLRGQ